MERVTFTSSGLTIAGDLHMPDGGGAGLPALALTGPLTGVKDQVVGVYAKRLAERGFVALAFDHRNFGESEGTPRQHEDQAGKVVDLRDAVSYLASRPEVDPDRIGIVGVCLGGSYAVKSAAFDPRVRAVAGIAAAYNSPHRMRDALGAEGFRERLGDVVANLARESEGGEVAYMPAVSQEGPAAMGGEEPFAYYGTERSKSAVWENRLSLASFWQLMTLDALSAVALLDQTPFLVVHGKIDAYCTPEGAQIAFDRAPGPKEIEWLDTSNHIDLYDQPQFVDAAVDRTAAFFAERLAGDRVAA
jgi:uncharacterized protein